MSHFIFGTIIRIFQFRLSCSNYRDSTITNKIEKQRNTCILCFIILKLFLVINAYSQQIHKANEFFRKAVHCVSFLEIHLTS